MDKDYRTCKECNLTFDSSFELIDHLMDDNYEFDPYYVFPEGSKLMLGSLLRFIYHHANEPEQIKLITQQSYITMFAFEFGYDDTLNLIEDMIVESNMLDFDKGLKTLLEGNNEEGRE